MNAPTFPPSIKTISYPCEYCGQERPCVRVRIADPRDDWMLCAPCVQANHTDEEIRAALHARQDAEHAARQASAAQQAEEALTVTPPAYTPTPYVYSRQHAIDVCLTSWLSESIDDRQCERLCARVHAGYYDDPHRFYRDETAAQVRHAKRMHRRLGRCRGLYSRHCSGLSNHDIAATAEDLRHLIFALDFHLALPRAEVTAPDYPADWPFPDFRLLPNGKPVRLPFDYAARRDLLKRRFRWMTGEDWKRPGWEYAA